MIRKAGVLTLLAFAFTACATATYLPSLGNVKSYQNCVPVYSWHRPASAAILEQQVNFAKTLKETLKENPSLLDKVVSSSALDSLGKNAGAIGSATASIAGSFSDMNPSALLANVIGGVAVQGIQAMGNIRSETSDQDRGDVCYPVQGAVKFAFNRKTSIEEVNIVIDNSDKGDTAEVIESSKSKWHKVAS